MSEPWGCGGCSPPNIIYSLLFIIRGGGDVCTSPACVVTKVNSSPPNMKGVPRPMLEALQWVKSGLVCFIGKRYILVSGNGGCNPILLILLNDEVNRLCPVEGEI